MEFEAFAYRVQSRFGSILQVNVHKGEVTITGPRISPALYRFWLGSQAALLILAIIALIVALVFWNWIYLLTGVVLIALHGIVGGVGAGCLWELERLVEFGEDRTPKTVSFHVSEVKNVRIGVGWARGAIRWIIAPYIPGINQMAKDMAVSFEAPDGVLPGSTVFALHMRSKEDADNLAMVLRAEK
jgi:hypothetical protein